jgi:hypothetical protein
MIDENTNWPRLYGIAALIGAAFGLLLSLGALPFAPEWPGGGDMAQPGPLGRILVPVVGGALLGVLFAGASHLGVTCQLRRWSRHRK